MGLVTTEPGFDLWSVPPMWSTVARCHVCNERTAMQRGITRVIAEDRARAVVRDHIATVHPPETEEQAS